MALSPELWQIFKPFLIETFFKRTTPPETLEAEDWYRAISGFPHKNAAHHPASYLLFVFEGLLNTLKLIFHVAPMLLAFAITHFLKPHFDYHLDRLRSSRATKGERAQSSGALLLILLGFVANAAVGTVAFGGGCLCAGIDMFHLAEKTGTRIDSLVLGTTFSALTGALSIGLHAGLILLCPPVLIALAGLKLLAWGNVRIQKFVSTPETPPVPAWQIALRESQARRTASSAPPAENSMVLESTRTASSAAQPPMHSSVLKKPAETLRNVHAVMQPGAAGAGLTA